MKQCELVTEILSDPDLRTQGGAKGITLPQGANCCTNSTDYDFWFYLDESLRKLGLLQSWQSDTDGLSSIDKCMEQVGQWRPVAFRIGYQSVNPDGTLGDERSGHFAVMLGRYSNDPKDDTIFVDDPFYGISRISFDKLVNGIKGADGKLTGLAYNGAKLTHTYYTKPQA